MKSLADAGLCERLRSEVDHPHVELRGGFCLIEQKDARAILDTLERQAYVLDGLSLGII